jgi:hypothetical protein
MAKTGKQRPAPGRASIPHNRKSFERSDLEKARKQGALLASGLNSLHAESRGIRDRLRQEFEEASITALGREVSPDSPDNRYYVLLDAAHEVLQRGKEKNLIGVLHSADRSTLPAELTPDEQDHMLGSAWVSSIHRRKGSLSPEAIAADFLFRSHRLAQALKDDQDMFTWALVFADAWHWLHLEVLGEHRAAYDGVKARQGREMSAPARSKKKADREHIVREVYRERRLGTRNPKVFKNASSAAATILDEVNARLKERGSQTYTEKTLQKILGPVVKDHNRSTGSVPNKV